MSSSIQSAQSKRVRGNDFSDAETRKALLHAEEQQRISNNRSEMLKALEGNKERYQLLVEKTLPLNPTAPAYIEAP